MYFSLDKIVFFLKNILLDWRLIIYSTDMLFPPKREVVLLSGQLNHQSIGGYGPFTILNIENYLLQALLR